MLCNQAVAGCAVNNKSLVQPCFDAIIEPAFDIFQKRGAGGTDSFEKFQLNAALQTPAIGFQAGLGKAEALLGEEICKFLDGGAGLPVEGANFNSAFRLLMGQFFGESQSSGKK